MKNYSQVSRIKLVSKARHADVALFASAILIAAAPLAPAQWVDVISENFEAQPLAATSLAASDDADPAAPFVVTDDDPVDGSPGAGVQVASWAAKSGSRSLLVRSGSETILQFGEPRSGLRYQLDFELNTVMGDGDRNFYLTLRSMGLDSNGEDFLAYRADRGPGKQLFHYQGIGQAAWTAVPATERTEAGWQHHRFIIDMGTQTFDLYLDDMATPAVTGATLSRPAGAVPTSLIIRHEGNSADDGYFLIDDISLKVEGSRDLTTAFAEGFESYPALVSFLDDADPATPWVVSEVDGSGSGKSIDPSRIQVVDATVTAARTGAKCVKLEGGQQAGISYSWGSASEQDVEITWWAKVPESIAGLTANYLRMSLYGLEGGRSDGGDAALLGYGSRDATVGNGTSLTVYTTGWQDTQFDYTPDTWEEYRLTTHTAEGTYSIAKNPSSPTPQIIADHLPFIGSAVNWGPMFMVAWSSSNGTGHPPVYLDDIQIKAVTPTVGEPIVAPYAPVSADGRFGNATVLRLPGPAGAAAVDPRDPHTIVVAIDSTSGALYQVKQDAAGIWAVDEIPLVTGLSNPSGLVIDAAGTIWWTHDFTQSLRRLRAPWRDNAPEIMISSFGLPATDDDPIDLTLTGSGFNGIVGRPGAMVVADRDVDAFGQRGLYIFDPATLSPGTVDFTPMLAGPGFELGFEVLNAVTYLPASAEVVTVNNDETIALTNADGLTRTLSVNTPFSRLMGVAADPVTGRIWLADRDLAEIWSVSAAVGNAAPETKEVSFTLTDETRPDRQIQFHDPGLAFSTDGSMLVIADGSAQNRGGWLTILSSAAAADPVVINLTELSPAGFKLGWTSQEGAKYRVLRSAAPDQGFTDISGELTDTDFTDATPLTGKGFYRVRSTR